MYDQLKVAQFALKQEWFESNERTAVFKYKRARADKKIKEGEKVPSKYENVLEQGEVEASNEFN
jgi:hypothetical protein